MKKIINIVAAAAIIAAIASCSMTKQHRLVGAYTEYHSVSAEADSLFKAAYKGTVTLKPLKVATQVVAGTNYSFICKSSSGDKYKVVIFQPLPGQGDAEVTSVEKL